ncbi:MAG: PAS domain S-box protein [Steroidobacteraceae bacterium]
MSGDRAAQRRVESTAYGEGLNRLLEKQIREARRRGGELDLDTLMRSISLHYDRIEEERRGIVRSMQLMSEEAQALTREIREQSASHLQAILDNVKDAIITVDEQGHIETCNPTGERIFGYSQTELLGRTLDFLLPEIVSRGGSRAFLEQLAARVDDTHIDLAAHQIWGNSKGGERFVAEIAVSKAKLNRRDGYIVCIRDTTERHISEQHMRDSEARYRTLVENAPEVIVVFDVDQQKFIDVNENACRFFRMDRSALLAAGPDRVSPVTQPDGTSSFGVVRGYVQSALDGAAPVFEWMHCDASGRLLPCEVRLVRLPSSSRRLIRGSITHIAERKRNEAIASGERRVFEKIAANAPLPETLGAIAEVIERVMEGAACAINLLDQDSNCLMFGVAPSHCHAASSRPWMPAPWAPATAPVPRRCS